jgi:hypothetical protein
LANQFSERLMKPPTTDQMVAGLVAKRQEIAAQIEASQRQVKEAVALFDRVEATIRIFKPDMDFGELSERPVPPAHNAFKGEVRRILLTTLRDASAPLSTSDLTEVLMQARGLPLDDRRLRRTMLGRVGSSLNTLRRKHGVVKSTPGTDGLLLWEFQTA